MTPIRYNAGSTSRAQAKTDSGRYQPQIAPKLAGLLVAVTATLTTSLTVFAQPADAFPRTIDGSNNEAAMVVLNQLKSSILPDSSEDSFDFPLFDSPLNVTTCLQQRQFCSGRLWNVSKDISAEAIHLLFLL